jgi:hypothetical protein
MLLVFQLSYSLFVRNLRAGCLAIIGTSSGIPKDDLQVERVI